MGALKDNRLNSMADSAPWMKFLKSWFVFRPPPRDKGKELHPATFPAELAQEHIEFFTKTGGHVLEPFCGTGSTLVGAARCGRNAVGIELNEKYAGIARGIVADAIPSMGMDGLDLECSGTVQRVICGNSLNPLTYADLEPESFDYVFTSPPDWDMLHRAGPHQDERVAKGLDQVYSDDERDLGNIHDYDKFINFVGAIFANVDQYLKPGGYATVVLQNLNRDGQMYPVAWDCASAIRGATGWMHQGEKIWCQDDKSIFPFALGKSFCTNVMHQYCLNFRKPKVDG